MPQMWSFIAAWLLTLLILVGNGLLIYLFWRTHQLHAPSNWFIVSLAVADLGVGLSLLPVDSLCTIPSVSCSVEFLAMSQWFFLYASVANLCAMTLDRYTAVVKPFQYAVFFMRRNKVVLLICAAWVAPLIVCFLPATFVFTRKKHNFGMRIYSIVPILLFEIFPLFFLAVATGRILYIARRHARQTAIMLNQLRCNRPINGSTPRSHRGNANGSVRATGTVVAIFLLCYSFSLYMTFCGMFVSCKRPQEEIQFLSVLLNSSANPLVYGFLKKDIKREVKNLFCRRMNR